MFASALIRGFPKIIPKLSALKLLHGAQTHPNLLKMPDTEMDGGVALDGSSPTHSELADQINEGAMDVKSPHIDIAPSLADSTMSSRLCVSKSSRA